MEKHSTKELFNILHKYARNIRQYEGNENMSSYSLACAAEEAYMDNFGYCDHPFFAGVDEMVAAGQQLIWTLQWKYFDEPELPQGCSQRHRWFDGNGNCGYSHPNIP